MKRNSKIALVIIIVLIILGIVAGGLYWWRSKEILKQSIKPNQENSAVPKSNQESNSYKPNPEPVISKNITINTGLTDSQLNPGQYLPYDLKTAKGHYLIRLIPNVSNSIKERLIYDGKDVVLSGKVVSTGLSRNGVHYIYSIDNGTSDDLYLDGKKISSDTMVYDPRVTDDGQHYFYISQANRDTNSIGGILKKDGTTIYSHDAGILLYQISFDGQHYLIQPRTINPSNGYSLGSFVLDGKEMSTSGDTNNIRDGELLLSNNGEHYGYILTGKALNTDSNGISTQFGNESLYIDGQKILESKLLYSLRITDSGGYAVSAPEDKVFYTNLNNIPMRSDPLKTGAILIFINEDMSHYLLQDSGWILDGIEISYDGSNVELSGDTMYSYKVTK